MVIIWSSLGGGGGESATVSLLPEEVESSSELESELSFSTWGVISFGFVQDNSSDVLGCRLCDVIELSLLLTFLALAEGKPSFSPFLCQDGWGTERDSGKVWCTGVLGKPGGWTCFTSKDRLLLHLFRCIIVPSSKANGGMFTSGLT